MPPKAKKKDQGAVARLAAEARKLAMECVAGTAPRFITGALTLGDQHCALGEAMARAAPDGIPQTTRRLLWSEIGEVVDAESQEAATALVDANNHTADVERHSAVVFPLLWFADTLEALAAAAQAPHPSPRQAE